MFLKILRTQEGVIIKARRLARQSKDTFGLKANDGRWKNPYVFVRLMSNAKCEI